ncbi:MAG TPA: pentapeptide repeat-containing protein [Nostocaceae cyanobacterium]|nr:pentapeptide repeat-containing protein [Nostocaceae cyanobacterium]
MTSDINVKKKTKITYTASKQGVERAKKALQRLGFDSQDSFAKSIYLSRSTLTKFLYHRPIQLDSFKRICEALELNWQEIIAIDQEQELSRMSQIDHFEELNINQEDGIVPRLIREVIVKDTQNLRTKLTITLKGEIDEVQDPKIIQSILREYSGDTIEITAIREGSIKLTIKGSQEDIEKLISCIKSGELRELNGFPIEDIEIFSEDLDKEDNNKINNKWDLVREIVTQGAEEKNLQNADLSDADLSNADLSRANLNRADLSNANLSHANLIAAKLFFADLSCANLISTDLMDAKLTHAKLTYAELTHANLIAAKLTRADLTHAYLSFANFSSTDLSRAYLNFAKLTGVNLSNANLIGANLIGADLNGADLNGADLNFADLNSADLSRANLSRANLIGTNLNRANLSRANLSNADLFDAKVENAIFGDNEGISLEERDSLILRGAIFRDSPGDRSEILTPH